MLVIVSTNLSEEVVSSDVNDVEVIKRKLDRIISPSNNLTPTAKAIRKSADIMLSNVIDSGVVNNIGIYISEITDLDDIDFIVGISMHLNVSGSGNLLSYSMGCIKYTLQICVIIGNTSNTMLGRVSDNLSYLGKYKQENARDTINTFLCDELENYNGGV